MPTKRMRKKLDGNYTRILWAILNNSWRQHSTKQQLYDHLPPITKTIQIKWTTHMGHIRKDKIIRDVLLWTPSIGQVKVGWPARNYQQQLCANIGCSLEDLPGEMDDRDEKAREICVSSMTWWWSYSFKRDQLYVDILIYYLSWAWP